jgi:hypothetical protein
MNWLRQPTDRLEVLRTLDHFHDWRSLEDERLCKMCGRTFSGHEVEIVPEGDGFKLSCPTRNCQSEVHHWIYPDHCLFSAAGYEGWWQALSSNGGSDNAGSTPSPQPI